jgi:dipeptidyl aminopeptidase/acylaminoacyl peptidase
MKNIYQISGASVIATGIIISAIYAFELRNIEIRSLLAKVNLKVVSGLAAEGLHGRAAGSNANFEDAKYAQPQVTDQQFINNCHLAPPAKVLQDVLAQGASAVSTSPDGGRALTKYRHEHSYELVVKDLHSSRQISRSSVNSQVALTWSPDGTKIAYMARRSAGKPFLLYLWDLKRNTVDLIRAPESDEASSPIRWSPQGDRLLYGLVKNHVVTLELVLLNEKSKAIAAAHVKSGHGYEWKKDGEQFTAVISDKDGALATFEKDGHRARTIQLAAKADIDSLTWDTEGHTLFVAMRKPKDRWFHILSVNEQEGRPRECLTFTGDLMLPVALPSGEVVVQAAYDDRSVLAKAQCGDHLQFIGPREGLVVPESFSSASDSLNAFYVSTQRPGVLIAVDVTSGKFKTNYAPPNAQSLEIPAPKRFSIPVTGGKPIHGLIWRARNPPAAGRRVVVTAHGGGSGWFIEQQIVLAAGGDYVVVQDRSNAKFGDAFEDHYDVAPHVEDIVRGIRYAISTLHPSTGKVILDGASYGAFLVTRAARQHPELVESLVVESMTNHDPRHETFQPVPTPPYKVYEFHGDSDPGMNAEDARREVELIAGAGATSPPAGCFCVFKKEGHTISESANIATMWGILASLVNSPSGSVVTGAGAVQ